MNETNSHLLASARNYVSNVFTHNVKSEFVFHNIEHTEDVVEACSRMADHYQLNEDDKLVLLLAAWFHDVGYSSGSALGHEEESIKLATQFLTQQGTDATLIQRVSSCIAATKMPQSPVSLVEKILCDADLYHLATDDFKARNQLLKQEIETVTKHKIPKKDWQRENISFLANHKYFTDYGQELLEPKKQENLNVLKRKKGKDDALPADTAFPYTYLPSVSKKEEAKVQQKNVERGVQTMFRITSSNHLRLSGMSDSKAHIPISVNAIIISVVLTVSVRQHIPYLTMFMYPIGMLLLVCLATIVFAILATRPSITGGRFTEEDIRNKKTNLLFFGNFYRMELENYTWAMNQMMKDADYLYDSMIKDIYFLGIVLAKKYRYLRIAYTIFMWGLIAAVITFAIAAVVGVASAHAAPTTVIDY